MHRHCHHHFPLHDFHFLPKMTGQGVGAPQTRVEVPAEDRSRLARAWSAGPPSVVGNRSRLLSIATSATKSSQIQIGFRKVSKPIKNQKNKVRILINLSSQKRYQTRRGTLKEEEGKHSGRPRFISFSSRLRSSFTFVLLFFVREIESTLIGSSLEEEDGLFFFSCGHDGLGRVEKARAGA